MATKTMAKKSAPGAARQKKQVLPDVPDKLYYRIGEVARLCGVETYVLRFWETEFPQLKPNKSGAGQRLYRRREVDLARRIRHLLYEEGYTIPGARQAIQTETRKPGENGQMQLAEAGLKSRDQAPRLNRVRAELREILGMLSPSVRPRAESTRSDRKGEAEIKELFD
jgi:DNA-binding transcriptional MerR regulator